MISHACVIVESNDTRILCDPWLFGGCFNDSWLLLPPAAWDPAWLRDIDYLWISHEHPDHFHIPTLRSFPAEFKARVIVLYQKNNSHKIWDELIQLGYMRHKALPHREVVRLTPETSVYCYQEGQMNSSLAVMSAGQAVLNVNDAELRKPDCNLIRRAIGKPNVVLNQFSIAGYGGLAPADAHLKKVASSILTNVVANHRDLGAEVTIPFASFMYFSAIDNWYVNNHANRPRDVAARLRDQQVNVVTLYPGDSYVVGGKHENEPSLRRFDEAYASFGRLTATTPPRVELADIEAAFHGLCVDLRHRYPKGLLRALRPFSVHIVDLRKKRSFAVSTGEVSDFDELLATDLDVYSQPLWFAFKYAYGVQTLGVSARVMLRSGVRNWQAHRVLFAMNNAEVYLRPKLFFTGANLRHIRKRLRGGASQLIRRLRAGVV